MTSQLNGCSSPGRTSDLLLCLISGRQVLWSLTTVSCRRVQGKEAGDGLPGRGTQAQGSSLPRPRRTGSEGGSGNWQSNSRSAAEGCGVCDDVRYAFTGYQGAVAASGGRGGRGTILESLGPVPGTPAGNRARCSPALAAAGEVGRLAAGLAGIEEKSACHGDICEVSADRFSRKDRVAMLGLAGRLELVTASSSAPVLAARSTPTPGRARVTTSVGDPGQVGGAHVIGTRETQRGTRMAEPEPTGLKGKTRREGQVISSEGDEQRCRQLLAATVEDLKGRMAALIEAMEEDGEKVMFEDTDMLSLRSGMDDTGPRLYEEVVWARVLRRKWRPVWRWAYALKGGLLRKLVGKLRILSRWAQIRKTPGVVIHVHLADVWSTPGWTGQLTVAADGAVQFSGSGSPAVPATENSLREWIDRWKAEVPAEARTKQKKFNELRKLAEEQAKRRKEEAEEKAERARVVNQEWAEISRWRDIRRRAIDGSIGIKPRSGDYELALSRVKLKQAMALLCDEIALRGQEDPHGPRFNELATVDDPKMIRWDPRTTHWGRERRMYEETVAGFGDPDDDRSRWEETYTVGCRWQYGGLTAVMTVNAHGVVEIDSGGVTGTATSDDLRAILDRAPRRQSLVERAGPTRVSRTLRCVHVA